jgi:hypothetical protein
LNGRLRAALPKEVSMNSAQHNPPAKEKRTMVHSIEYLATSFHGLRTAPGTWPWDALRLDSWAAGPAPGRGAFCAAKFVLAVWNPRAQWECGRFDLMEALACWDAEHHAAFLEWAREPWWP